MKSWLLCVIQCNQSLSCPANVSEMDFEGFIARSLWERMANKESITRHYPSRVIHLTPEHDLTFKTTKP